MEDLPLGRIAALVPEFWSEGPALGQNTDDIHMVQGRVRADLSDLFVWSGRANTALATSIKGMLV